MFGTYRFVLAMMVVVAHLWTSLTDWTGIYAVFGFYLLSGYLMTFVLNERYGFNLIGLQRYAVNRILRIYPIYLVIFFFSLGIVLIIGDQSKNINEVLTLPTSFIGWLHNIFIVGLNGDFEKLVPPAWSVDVEIFFYFIMALGFARNKWICLLWFLASIIATVYMIVTHQIFPVRYTTITGASLPYSMGAMIYFWRLKFQGLSRYHVIIATIIFAFYVIYSGLFWEYPMEFGFYISLIASLYLQISLTCVNKNDVPRWLRRIDDFLGDLSYPVFLCHWQVATLVLLGPFRVRNRGFGLFVCGGLGAIILACLLRFLVDKPIEKIRTRIRNRADREIIEQT